MEDKIIGREDVKKLRGQGIINTDNEITKSYDKSDRVRYARNEK